MLFAASSVLSSTTSGISAPDAGRTGEQVAVACHQRRDDKGRRDGGEPTDDQHRAPVVAVGEDTGVAADQQPDDPPHGHQRGDPRRRMGSLEQVGDENDVVGPTGRLVDDERADQQPQVANAQHGCVLGLPVRTHPDPSDATSRCGTACSSHDSLTDPTGAAQSPCRHPRPGSLRCMVATDCLFCKIVAGEIPATKVYEDNHVVAFEDLNPQAPTHVLVVPREHLTDIAELGSDRAVAGSFVAGIRAVAQELGVEQFRTVFNTGAEVGQSVFHVHAHLMAGRPMGWPPG
jgi:histidine triad (HIT) family protein